MNDNYSLGSTEDEILYNFPFCALLIYQTIREYIKNTKENKGFPIPLLYLVLPLVLPEENKTKLKGKRNFVNFIKENQLIYINFSKQVNKFQNCTNYSIELLLLFNSIKINSLGYIDIDANMNIKKSYINDDYKDLQKNCKIIGKWFSMHNPSDIYVTLGVRP